MTYWREQYFQALKDCEGKKVSNYAKIDKKLIEAYTSLLDRIAALEAFKSATKSTEEQTGSQGSSDPTKVKEIALLRSNLTEALRSNGQLHSRLNVAEAGLRKLNDQCKSDVCIIEELSKDRTILTQKLKDKDEELRGKAKLLDNVHNEVVSLNIQLNMLELKFKDLQLENQSLVDRWIARKNLECEKMNEEAHG